MADDYQLVQRLREVVDQSDGSGNPQRKREAQECIATLEYLMSGSRVHSGNPNLRPNAIRGRARRVLMEWDDWGPLLDDPGPDDG